MLHIYIWMNILDNKHTIYTVNGNNEVYVSIVVTGYVGLYPKVFLSNSTTRLLSSLAEYPSNCFKSHTNLYTNLLFCTWK